MSERYKFVDGHAHFISCAFVSSIKDAAYIWSNADPHLGFEFDEGKGAKGEKEARALTLAPVEGKSVDDGVK